MKEANDEAIMKHRERQKEYSKRTNYASQRKSDAKNTKTFLLRASYNTEGDIIEKLEKVDNINGYIKSLIRKDISENGL